MDLTAIIAWFQTPQGYALLGALGTLVASAFHAAGWNVPLFSPVVNAAVAKVTGSAPDPTPNVIGGQQAPAALSPTSIAAAPSHPLFDAIAGLLAKRTGGALAANHPIIQAAASAAIADAPTFLKLLAEVAPLVLAAGS